MHPVGLCSQWSCAYARRLGIAVLIVVLIIVINRGGTPRLPLASADQAPRGAAGLAVVFAMQQRLRTRRALLPASAHVSRLRDALQSLVGGAFSAPLWLRLPGRQGTPDQPAGQLAALLPIARATTAPGDPAHTLPALLTPIAGFFGAQWAALAALDPAQGQLTLIAGHPQAVNASAERRLPWPAELGQVPGAALPLVIETPQADPRLAQLYARPGLATGPLVIVPLCAGDQPIGALLLALTQPRALDAQALQAAPLIAGYAAAALAHSQLYAEAQQARQLKSSILDTISHEFRTPITAILGFTELYQEHVLGPVSAEQHEALDAIYRNTHRLLKLVDDMLDLARIATGKLDLLAGPVHTELYVREANTLLAPRLAQQQVSLALEFAQPLPLAWADARWLRRVLLNLVAYLLQSASVHSIRIRTGIAATQHGTPEIQIEIAGDSFDVPEHERATFFEAFVVPAAQFVNTPARLGLAISKYAVSAMGGQLTLVQPAAGASAFLLTLRTAEGTLDQPT